MIKSKQKKFKVTCGWYCFMTWKVICVLKFVSITHITIQHFMEAVIR